jgi:hypothetical protein
MSTIDLSRINDLAESGYAPDIATARAALASGRLFDVDTQNAGEDCVLDAASAEEALAEIAYHCGLSDVPTRWTATRLTAILDTLAD